MCTPTIRTGKVFCVVSRQKIPRKCSIGGGEFWFKYHIRKIRKEKAFFNAIACRTNNPNFTCTYS